MAQQMWGKSFKNKVILHVEIWTKSNLGDSVSH